MFDPRAQARDLAFFSQHPERKIFARLASEVEEIGARRAAGIDPENHGTTTIMIIRRGTEGQRERVAYFLPSLYGKPVSLPADESFWLRIFEGAG